MSPAAFTEASCTSCLPCLRNCFQEMLVGTDQGWFISLPLNTYRQLLYARTASFKNPLYLPTTVRKLPLKNAVPRGRDTGFWKPAFPQRQQPARPINASMPLNLSPVPVQAPPREGLRSVPAVICSHRAR